MSALVESMVGLACTAYTAILVLQRCKKRSRSVKENKVMHEVLQIGERKQGRRPYCTAYAVIVAAMVILLRWPIVQ